MARAKKPTLRLHPLEARDVPAATFSGGTLTLVGTPGNDSFQVVEANGLISVVGQKITANGKAYDGINSALVKAIYSNLGSGNDFLDASGLSSAIPLTVIGGAGDDYIAGGPGSNSLYGRDGNDTLIGGDGKDKLYGEGGDDVIQGLGGNDFISGGAGDDEIDGGDGNDKINGDAGDDSILGGAGKDKIDGGDGDDEIDGGDGNDIILGSAGNDNLDGGDGNDTIYGGAGNDSANGGLGNDLIFGDDGNDFLHGDDGNDTIAGGAGADFVYGDDGEDTLFPGSLTDIVDGGGGDDVIDENNGDGDGGGNQNTGAVTPTIRSEWSSGLTADIAVNNAGKTTMKGWTVEFDADFVITTMWNATFTRFGKHYIVKSKPNFFNTNIPSGGTVQFGFNANKALDGTTHFNNITLNGQPV